MVHIFICINAHFSNHAMRCYNADQYVFLIQMSPVTFAQVATLLHAWTRPTLASPEAWGKREPTQHPMIVLRVTLNILITHIISCFTDVYWPAPVHRRWRKCTRWRRRRQKREICDGQGRIWRYRTRRPHFRYVFDNNASMQLSFSDSRLTDMLPLYRRW